VIATMYDSPLEPSNFAELGPSFSVLQEALRDGRALHARYVEDVRSSRRVFAPPAQMKDRPLSVLIDSLEARDADGEPRHYAMIKWSLERGHVAESLKFK